MTDTILITGANRGIGLALTRQILQDLDARIIAACRRPDTAEELRALAASSGGRVSLLQLDINDERSISDAVAYVASSRDALDALINNAGVNPRGDHQSSRLGQLSAADVGEIIGTNAVSPLILTQAFRGLLQESENGRVVMISSGMGSMARARGDAYAYRMSKAAMNMAARVLALDPAMGGVITVTVNPGWVKTDMGGPGASLTPTESASALVRLIAGLSATDNGKFFQYDGSELAW